MVRCVGGAWVVFVAGYGNVRHVVLLIVFCVVDFLISRFALDNAALVNSKINYLYSFRHSWNSKSANIKTSDYSDIDDSFNHQPTRER